jgi:hypothetical protein
MLYVARKVDEAANFLSVQLIEQGPGLYNKRHAGYARQDITISNATLPSDWKKVIVVTIHKGGDIAGLELQTRQFDLSGLQANGTRYCIVPAENLG